MEAKAKSLKIYLNRKGKAPFSHWLNSLKDIQGRAKIRTGLDRLCFGNLGHCRSLGGGLFELKIQFGPGYRVYFGQEGENRLILLFGGDKSSQGKDLEKAREFWSDYWNR